MKLNQTLLNALTTCGATDVEMASITSYYADQLTAANATVDQLKANVESLQTQIAEAEARVGIISAAIGKFVVPDA